MKKLSITLALMAQLTAFPAERDSIESTTIDNELKEKLEKRMLETTQKEFSQIYAENFDIIVDDSTSPDDYARAVRVLWYRNEEQVLKSLRRTATDTVDNWACSHDTFYEALFIKEGLHQAIDEAQNVRRIGFLNQASLLKRVHLLRKNQQQ